MKKYVPALIAALCMLAGCASTTTPGTADTAAGEPAQQASAERAASAAEASSEAGSGGQTAAADPDGLATLDAQETLGRAVLAKADYLPAGQRTFGQLGERQSVQVTWKLEYGKTDAQKDGQQDKRRERKQDKK